MILSQRYIKLNCEHIGNSFLDYNESLNKIDLPNVERIGNYFLGKNKSINREQFLKLLVMVS